MKSLGILLILAMGLSELFKKFNLPGLIGMILAGVIMGPSGLNLIEYEILKSSQTLRTISLIMILTRAGLILDLNKLNTNKRQVILLSFLPATFEMIGFCILSMVILKLSLLEGLLIGSILSAVSPAVIVPRMIKIKEEGYSKESGVADMVLAGSSMDDVYVIVIFTAVLSLLKGGLVSANILFSIPLSIFLGVIVGSIIGIILCRIFKEIKTNSYVVMILYSVSFILLGIEDIFNFSALISIITIGVVINKKTPLRANKLNEIYKSMWNIGEIILFSLLGVSINIDYIFTVGIISIILILLALCVRMIGVYISLIGSDLNIKQKLFIAISYLPKATVQAAIGGIALSEGLAIGETALTFAVLSIVMTAPLGAILIDKSYKKLLDK